MIRFIPNLITLFNLASGCIAITFILSPNGKLLDNLIIGGYLIILGAVFDFFDGFAARLLKVSGELGKQLDSLADMVTFGVAPALIVFKLLESHHFQFPLLNYLAILIALGSCYRLAKFNIDENQATGFIGLPTPANALFWISIPMILNMNTDAKTVVLMQNLFTNPIVLIVLIFVSTWVLNAKIPLFSLKFKTTNWADNKVRFIFLVLCAILILILHFTSIPFIILLYLILSIIFKTKTHEV